MAARSKLNSLIGLARGDDERRYGLAEWIARRIHDKAILGGPDRAWLYDEDFRIRYDQLKMGRSDRSMDRVYLLGHLARYASVLAGDTAECGSYSGMTSYEICHHTQPGKRHHVFDSFEGLSKPGTRDGGGWEAGDLADAQEHVARVLSSFDADIHRGWIPDRFEEVAADSFSLVHIDVDLYDPTRDSLAFFYERVVPGGMIVFDDYGFTSCPGATSAVDEFMADKPEVVVQTPTGSAFVVRTAQ